MKVMKHAEAEGPKGSSEALWNSVLSFFLKQEPGSVLEWRAERRSESESAQHVRRRV